MKKLIAAVLFASFTLASSFAQKAPEATTETVTAKKEVAKAPEVAKLTPPVTDAQRLHFREIERDFAQLQNVITAADAAKAAADSAKEKQEKLRTEAQGILTTMMASCKTTEQWEPNSLTCKPVEKAAVDPKK